MPSALKTVDPDYLSCRMDGSGYLGGPHWGFDADSQVAFMNDDTDWIALQLDYTVGGTVTPDPGLELSVKRASRSQLMRERAADSAGVYVWQWNGETDWHDSPALKRACGTQNWLTSFTGSGDGREPVPPYAHVIVVEYDEADVLGSFDEAIVGGLTILRLATCTVLERLSTGADP